MIDHDDGGDDNEVFGPLRNDDKVTNEQAWKHVDKGYNNHTTNQPVGESDRSIGGV